MPEEEMMIIGPLMWLSRRESSQVWQNSTNLEPK